MEIIYSEVKIANVFNDMPTEGSSASGDCTDDCVEYTYVESSTGMP
jgi:hypothetical protein